MKCQKCKNNEATTHVKRVINGVTEEYELCRDCAAHPLMNNNPVKMTEEKLREMFEALK